MLDVMGGGRGAAGAVGRFHVRVVVQVALDVEPIGGAAFGLPSGEVVPLSGGAIGTQRLDQIRVGSNILQAVESRGQTRGRVVRSSLG